MSVSLNKKENFVVDGGLNELAIDIKHPAPPRPRPSSISRTEGRPKTMAERTATASGTDNPASSSPVLTSVAAQENERGGDLEYDEAAAEPERIQGGDDGNTKPPRRGIAGKVEKVHSRVPALRKIPLAALGIIFLVAVVNGFVWMVAGIVLVCFSSPGSGGL